MSIDLSQMISQERKAAVLLGQFQNALNIKVGDPIIAFVLPQIGNGPFHVVVNALPQFQPQQTLYIQAGHDFIQLGTETFHIPHICQLWNPRPQWETMHLKQGHITLLQKTYFRILRKQDNHHLHNFDEVYKILTPAHVEQLRRVLLTPDSLGLIAAMKNIIGRGPGLTPTGDDFLAGIMLSLWALHHPEAPHIGQSILEAAQGRTTDISYAFLRSIAEGKVDEKWSNLLIALGQNHTRLLENQVQHILSFGATSGSDMFAGFLWGIQRQCAG